MPGYIAARRGPGISDVRSGDTVRGLNATGPVRIYDNSAERIRFVLLEPRFRLYVKFNASHVDRTGNATISGTGTLAATGTDIPTYKAYQLVYPGTPRFFWAGRTPQPIIKNSFVHQNFGNATITGQGALAATGTATPNAHGPVTLYFDGADRLARNLATRPTSRIITTFNRAHRDLSGNAAISGTGTLAATGTDVPTYKAPQSVYVTPTSRLVLNRAGQPIIQVGHAAAGAKVGNATINGLGTLSATGNNPSARAGGMWDARREYQRLEEEERERLRVEDEEILLLI